MEKTLLLESNHHFNSVSRYPKYTADRFGFTMGGFLRADRKKSGFSL